MDTKGGTVMLVITVLLSVVCAGSVALMLFSDRVMSGENGLSAGKISAALRPAMLFTLTACAIAVGFRVLYPLTAECRYWREEGWSGSWRECPGDELWKFTFVPAVWLILIIFGGIVVPRLTVKRLSADGVFSSRRYLLAVTLAESSLVIPLALYTLLFYENPFSWLSMMPSVGVWSFCRTLTATVTAVRAEKTWRSVRPERKHTGRGLAVTAVLVSYAMLTAGGHKMVRYAMGEYNECPCELEGLDREAAALICLSIVLAAAVLIGSRFITGIRRAAELAHEE